VGAPSRRAVGDPRRQASTGADASPARDRPGGHVELLGSRSDEADRAVAGRAARRDRAALPRGSASRGGGGDLAMLGRDRESSSTPRPQAPRGAPRRGGCPMTGDARLRAVLERAAEDAPTMAGASEARVRAAVAKRR